SGLNATSGATVSLNWTASPDSIAGYNVYRSPSPLGPFTRLNWALVTGTSYVDANSSSAHAGTYTYMVRAIKLQVSSSGSYFNSSQGIFDDASTGSGALTSDLSVTVNAAPSSAVTGTPISYTVSASNGGPADATGVVLTHTVPAGLTFVSASSGCSFSAGLRTCAVGSLAPRGRADYTLNRSGGTRGNFTPA